MTSLGHWKYEGEEFDPDDYFGFLYLIDVRLPDGSLTRYIGKKQFHTYVKRKRHKESKWRDYTSSSKHLNELLRSEGAEATFEIIQLFETRGGLTAGECKAQWHLDVLTEKDSQGTPIYLNRQIGAVKFIPKEAINESARDRLDELRTEARVLVEGQGQEVQSTEEEARS